MDYTAKQVEEAVVEAFSIWARRRARDVAAESATATKHFALLVKDVLFHKHDPKPPGPPSPPPGAFLNNQRF